MFTQILFHYDEKGQYLGSKKPGHVWPTDNPRILLANHCNATSFDVLTTTTRGHGGYDVPAVQISRERGPLSADPYNNDGRPATLMLTMAVLDLWMISGTIVIEGIEIPNLCWAGLLTLPYTMTDKGNRMRPKAGVRYMDDDLKQRVHRQDWHERCRQRIEIRP